MIDKELVKKLAFEAGFTLVGFAPAVVLQEEFRYLKEWLFKGYHAQMLYMENNTERRKDVKEILPEAKSVISFALNYYNEGEFSGDGKNGKISRYAWGRDYHNVLWEKLDGLIEKLREYDSAFEGMRYVDTGPVMDKAWAVRSGIGWQGKNSNIINREIGSWFFIGSIICNQEFEYDAPIEDYCGSCTACIEACPTQAIVAPYVVDGNKCISYLTIENKDEIPPQFKENFDGWAFGCDVCQDVCPWNNKFSVITTEPDFTPQRKEIPLGYFDTMEPRDFRKEFKESPILRAKLKGMRRNTGFLKK